MLEGMKILSFVQRLAGAAASQMLGDLGAEVVRIEWDRKNRNQKGYVFDSDDRELFFQITGRNQKSAVIDIFSEKGRNTVKALLEEYDIVLENCFSNSALNDFFDYHTFSEKHPGLIWCRCTCFGSGGPRKDEYSDDLLMQSFSGLSSLNGYRNKPPIPAGTSLVEQHMASLIVFGLIAAAFDRERTGKGHLIDVNMLSAAMDLQIETFGYYCNGGRFIERVDTGLSTRIHQSPYGVYATKDGYMVISLTHYDRLCSLFTPGSMDHLSEEAAMERREEFDRVVCSEMKKRTTAQWTELFSSLKDMWYAPVNEYDQVMEDEQIKHNAPFIRVGEKHGKDIYAMGHANRYDGKGIKTRIFPPDYGQDTESILKTIGMTITE